jgi:hypothetical protein
MKLSPSLILIATSAVTIATALPVKAVEIYNTNNGTPNGIISIYGDTVSGTSQQGVGMSFVPTATASLTQVQVLLAQSFDFPIPGSTVSFNIFQSNGSNEPNFGQALLTAFNLPVSGAIGSPVLESATFTNGPILNAGTQYWLVGTTSGNNSADWWGTNSNSGFFGFVGGNPPTGGVFFPDSDQKAFVISGNLVSTAVPEPFTVIGTIVGGTAALRLRNRLKADRK